MEYENAARQVLTGAWQCYGCKRLHQIENVARRCCATDVPCSLEGCNNRLEVAPNRGYITASKCCEECIERDRQARAKKQHHQWMEREKHPWDGKALLYSDHMDRYYTDLDELRDYYHDYLEEGMIDNVDGLELRICQPTKPPYFELSEYLYDCLPDDWDERLPGNAEEVEKMVNDYLQNHIFSWEPGPYALLITDEDLEPSPTDDPLYLSPFDGKVK